VTGTTERFGSIPHTYVLSLRDNGIRAVLQRRFIAEIDAISTHPTTVVEIDSSHSSFLSRPTVLATAMKTAHDAAGVPSSPHENGTCRGQGDRGV